MAAAGSSKLTEATVALAHSGDKMPLFGFGTWRASEDDTKSSVLAALEAGYRAIDCAAVYANEKFVGEALAEWLGRDGNKREDLFITSKLWNTMHSHVEEAIDTTLKDLGLEYVDLYLMHFPIAMAHGGMGVPRDADGNIELEAVTVLDTWKAMLAQKKAGKAKNVGVSNFHFMQLTDLAASGVEMPSVNQIQLHPYHAQLDLPVLSKRNWNMLTTAYSPLGGGFIKPMEDPVIVDLAKKHSVTPAQVILRWILQRDISVIPKSVNADRIKQNADLDGFTLDDDDMKAINGLDQGRPVDICKEFWGWSAMN